MTCPNSTESGCRCPEHHPGLGVISTEPVVLRLVTAGPSEPSSDQLVERMLKDTRAGCEACGNDPARCREGTGAPRFARLDRCAAFDDRGDLRPLKAQRQPRQPWEPKVA